MAVGDLAQYVVTGLLVGGVYALMSIGLALIFGVMRVVNFAQGDFMMLRMYLTWFLAVGAGVDPLLGALVTLPPFFLLGVLVSRAANLFLAGETGLPAWYQDTIAWFAILAVLALTGVVLWYLVINPSLPAENQIDMPIGVQLLLSGVVAFYFGARS